MFPSKNQAPALAELLDSQTTAMVFAFIKLANPSLTNVRPTVQAKLVKVFRLARYAEIPVFDVETNRVSCKKHTISLTPIPWHTLTNPVVANILSYCIEPNITVNDESAFARRECSLVPNFGNIGFPISMNEPETRMENVREFELFKTIDTAKKYHILRKYLARDFQQTFRRVCLANRTFFHPHAVRSEHEVRLKLKVDAFTFVEPDLMQVLRRTTLFNDIHPREYKTERGLNSKVLAVWSHQASVYADIPVSHDTRYDDLFLKYSSITCVHGAKMAGVKRKLRETNFEFVRRPNKKARYTVEAPDSSPVKDQPCGSPSKTWTGRMRFKRTWQYEHRDTKTGAVGFVNMGKLHQKKWSNLQSIRHHHVHRNLNLGWKCPCKNAWCLAGTQRYGPARRVRVRKDWSDYGDLLEEQFERRPKPVFKVPEHPVDELMRWCRQKNPGATFRFGNKNRLNSFSEMK